MISWTTQTRKLSDLKPYEYNPRVLTKDIAARLKKSITSTGYVEIIAIDFDNTIIAGHQRYNILKQMYGDDHEIEVRVPERKLTEKEFKDYLLASNKDVGDWDYEILSMIYEADELIEKGFSEKELGIDIDIDDKEKKDKKKKKCPDCGYEW